MSENSVTNSTTKQVVLFIILAYLFSFLVRMIWVWQFNDYAAFHWNNQLMINTNDGYYFASIAQHSLEGIASENPRIPSVLKYGLSILTTLLVKITPFSLETIILYLPAVISSLVVIPIILISKLYHKLVWGFFAALLGSVAWSYYNRTMVGYYDTDMFAAMAPMFVLYFLMKSSETLKLKNAFYAAIAIIIYPLLYDQGQSIVYAMGIMYALYVVFYHRKDLPAYASLILILSALIPFDILQPYGYIVQMIIITSIYYILQKRFFSLGQLFFSSLILFIIFLYLGNVFHIIYAKVVSYTITGTGPVNSALHFFQVNQTVREAGQIPFSTFANRISGSEIGVLLSLIGYILLIIKHRAFILALPLVGIGVFALFGGLRFTVYAVPIAALSAVYLFAFIGDFFKDIKLKYIFMAMATSAMLYPNIIHIVNYKVPTVFNKTEVNILDQLKNNSSQKDYTLAWWDYGYPIWYYSNTNTLIDGGKHQNDNYIISKILTTTSQVQAANLSRLAVETYVKSNYKVVADTIFNNKKEKKVDPNLLLDELSLSDYKLPKKTRDIFIYLPNRMLNILPTVALFSNLDLKTGKKNRRAFFYTSQNFKDDGKVLHLGNNISLYKKTGEINIGKQKLRINNFIVTQYDKKGKLQKNIQILDRSSSLNVIYMKNYNKFLVLDSDMFHSLFIQMFVLEEYDHTLFEPIILNPLTKVYKLKI